MMKFIIPMLLFVFTSYPSAIACTPAKPQDVVIARVVSTSPIPNKTDSTALQLHSFNFVFLPWYHFLSNPTPNHFEANFSLQTIQPNDLIIGLAHTPDDSKPQDYLFLDIAKLTCQDNKLILDKPIAKYLGWNRKNNSCRHDKPNAGILDGFMATDQTYYLQLLQQKYPTCEKLEQAFPKVVFTNGKANPPPNRFWQWLTGLF